VRILVTGWDGLVGRELRREAARRGGLRLDGGDLPGLDCRDAAAIRRRAARFRPDWIVHLAAFTAVDACEAEPGRALETNGLAAGHAADAGRRAGARVLLVSTDYVLDGEGEDPADESRRPAPLSAYGRSKLLGEQLVRERAAPGRWTVVRGQSLYGAGRKSFPDAILAAAAARPEVPVVTDQVVQPTWARDFAAGLLDLVAADARGLLHLAAAGSCTWNEFARAVLEEAGLDPARIVPTTAAALGRPAPRPARSVFATGRFERATGRRPRPWREQLRDYLRATGRAAPPRAAEGRAA
jgi:dTDP-4-dehydrorhamnose reductase